MKDKKEPILLANWIMCPNGTMIPSMHRHDYKEYVNEDGSYSSVDGGLDYLRRGGKYTEMSVYSDDPFEVIRRFVCRGGRGKEGKEPLTYVPLFRMSDEWLKATIEYIENDNIYKEYYEKELEYRKENNVTIKE
ncbi:MAG TPA: hypothetical protein VK982_05755 [Bacteroidales bacterium]|nr:hypothetical protein [Bacteroidales bacterium]